MGAGDWIEQVVVVGRTARSPSLQRHLVYVSASRRLLGDVVSLGIVLEYPSVS